MEGDREKADLYRERARQVRNIAQGLADRSSRTTLLQVASDYDRMAEALDLLAGADSATARPN
jgi:hypothetical protein